MVGGGLGSRSRTCRERHGLSRPKTNVWIGPFELDALWPKHRLAVELDGWTNHRTRHAFQHDRTKANALQATGLRVLRYTYADVVNRPAEVARELRGVLTA